MDEELLKTVAQETERWMKEIGAVHDNERKQRSYVTSADWEEHFGPIYGLAGSDIGAVVQAAHSMGIWIAFEPFKGWYLGETPADAASVVTRLVNYMCRLSETVNGYLVAQQSSGHMPEISDGYKGRLRVVDVDQITPLLTAAGVEVAEQVKVALLEASTRMQESE